MHLKWLAVAVVPLDDMNLLIRQGLAATIVWSTCRSSLRPITRALNAASSDLSANFIHLKITKLDLVKCNWREEPTPIAELPSIMKLELATNPNEKESTA